MHGAHRRGGRWARQFVAPGEWSVRARVERFVEPALLLALREGRTHGYELAERLAAEAGVDVDYGNLYRLLRRLEGEGIVTSEWNDDLPGRSKRTYELTPAGGQLLDHWAEALRTANDRIASFLERYEEGNQ